MKKYQNFAILLCSLFSLMPFFAAAAQSEVVTLPESRDEQYRTFGLFIDNQSSALFMPTGNNVWLSLGEQLPLVEFKDWYGSPQLVMYASVNAGDTVPGSTILMETIDIRLGLSYEFSFNEKSRMAISVQHLSGHTSDSIQDQSLVAPNLGDEQILVRYFHDIEDRFRVGGTLKPFFAADPGMVHYASDQFGEWYPWGTAPSFDKFTPFIAGSLDESGPDKVRVNYHAQMGVYIGNHLQPVYKPNVRFVVGYYNGVDPRLKYAQLKDGLQRFYYIGAEVGL
jgi:hypothetical protein